MAVAVVIVLLVIGSILFHMFSPWWFTPLASNWGTMDNALIITFWITGVVFVAINLFMAYAVWRYRQRRGHEAEYDPENPKLELWLTGVTTVGVVAMLAPGLIVWQEFITVPEDAHVMEVMGQQWQWTYRFPGEDGVLGAADVSQISFDNPFGLKPDDPYGRDDVLIVDNEVHLPIDRPVKVLLRSVDVLHDFYVPQFRAKMDLVPGMVSYLWFTPTKTGTYEVMCAELCGLSHHNMRGYVVVDSQGDFEAWLGEQETFSDLLAQSGGLTEVAAQQP